MEKLEKICNIQQSIYVLNEIIKKEWEIYRKIETSVPTPIAPREPIGGHYRNIPDYNEEEYIKKAKAAGSGLGKFRENCMGLFYMLLQFGIIGMLVCWIPLVFLILSWPFSIGHTSRKAYKIYREDCKQIENDNEANRLKIEAYNRASIKYQKDVIEFESHSKTLKLKQAQLNKEIEKAREALTKLNMKYSILCGDAKIPTAYHNFVEIHMICGYLKTRNALTIDEAIQLFQEQANSGKLNSNIEYIKKNVFLYKNSMPEVISALEKCNSDIASLENDLYNKIKKVTNEDRNTETTLLSRLISDCLS